MLPPPRHIPPLGPGKVSARDRVRSQWYRVNLAPLEKAGAMTAKKAAAVLPGVLSGLRLDRRQVEAEVARVWNNLMAPDVVAHAQPTGMRKGTLFITVDSSVWLSEIVRYRRQEILDRLRHSFGPQFVKKLSFKLG